MHGASLPSIYIKRNFLERTAAKLKSPKLQNSKHYKMVWNNGLSSLLLLLCLQDFSGTGLQEKIVLCAFFCTVQPKGFENLLIPPASSAIAKRQTLHVTSRKFTDSFPL